MFPSLSLTSTSFSDTILQTVLQWIVVVGVAQNAWSFSIFTTLSVYPRQQPRDGHYSSSSSSTSSRGAIQDSINNKRKKSLSSPPVPYPWRHSMEQEQHHCEHRLDDIFLLDDEISESLGVAAASEGPYHLADQSFSYLEDVVAVEQDQSFSYLEDVVAVEQDAAAAAAIMMIDDEEDASSTFDGMTPTPDGHIF